MSAWAAEVCVPGTVTGAAEDEDEAGVDEVAASSSRTAEETIALRSTKDTVTIDKYPKFYAVTVPELPPATNVVGGVIEGGCRPSRGHHGDQSESGEGG